MFTRRYSSASRIVSVIDTERLKSGPPSSFERDPSQFLPQTYPTEDLHRMLRCYDRKAAEVLIQSYVNTWRRMGVEVDEENEEAKVELEAYRSGNDEAARQQISELWLRTKEAGT